MLRTRMYTALFVLAATAAASRATAQTVDIDLGGLVLVVSHSRTAQIFHIVDQLSEWEQYAHRQYGRWARTSSPLSQAERALLRRHAELRRARGWDRGFERAFYVDDDIEVAAARATAMNLLTAEEAETEKAILLPFVSKLTPLIEAGAGQITALTSRLRAESSNLRPLVEKLRRLAETKEPVRVPVFLVVNPEEGSGGGKAHSGGIAVEVQQEPDPITFLIHESLHTLLDPRRAEVTAAAASAGLTWQRLNEGIAYAIAPGLTNNRDTDVLAEEWARKTVTGATAADPFVQFYTVAMVIRPLLRTALDRGETLSEFLPKAVAAWRRVAPR